MSADYGATWTQYISSSPGATGIARKGVNALSIGRRFFIVAGSAGGSSVFNDVFVSYW